MEDQLSETAEFVRLQGRLDTIFASGACDSTVVVVPSLTLHADELRKISGVIHFEERLLFQVQTLLQPRARVVYVTSRPLDPALVNYAFDLVASLPNSRGRERLTLLDCADDSPAPLTAKILERPELMERIVRAVGDTQHSYLVTFVSTPMERALAVRLGIPLYSCDPALRELGSKSGSRKLFRASGVSIPPGFEDIRNERELPAALAALKADQPGVGRAIVKLDDSFAGGGNATFDYADAPVSGLEAWIAAELPRRLTFVAPAETWESYCEKLRDMGGVVEQFVDSPDTRSPSVQLEIVPKAGPRIISTHDQILGHAGQVFVGCEFPAHHSYRRSIQALALRAGEALAERGVLGHVSVDFVVENSSAGHQCHAVEINLRMGGTTTPYFILHGLVGGGYVREQGEYLTPEGASRSYVASDRIQNDRLKCLTWGDLIDASLCEGLHYNSATRTGVAFYMLGALAGAGKVGMVAVETDRDRARHLYDRTLSILDAAATRMGSPPAVGRHSG